MKNMIAAILKTSTPELVQELCDNLVSASDTEGLGAVNAAELTRAEITAADDLLDEIFRQAPQFNRNK